MLKREENAIVLDFLPSGRSNAARQEPIAQLLGDTYFTLLDVVVKPGVSLSPGERVYIGRDERDKVDHIKGRITFNDLTASAQREAEGEIRNLVAVREQDFVTFLNRAGAINIRAHSLELLPSIGKKNLQSLLDAREAKLFTSFEDVKSRVPGVGNVAEVFVQRIIEELRGESKYYLFTKAPSLREDDHGYRQ